MRKFKELLSWAYALGLFSCIFLVIFVVLLFYATIAYLVMNTVVPIFFEPNPVTYRQAFGIGVICWFIQWYFSTLFNLNSNNQSK